MDPTAGAADPAAGVAASVIGDEGGGGSSSSAPSPPPTHWHDEAGRGSAAWEREQRWCTAPVDGLGRPSGFEFFYFLYKTALVNCLL